MQKQVIYVYDPNVERYVRSIYRWQTGRPLITVALAFGSAVVVLGLFGLVLGWLGGTPIRW